MPVRTDPNPHDARIFCEWKNGTYINSMAQNFQKEFQKLVARLGPPIRVEYRDTWLQSTPEEIEELLAEDSHEA